jgi:hypothetical protein
MRAREKGEGRIITLITRFFWEIGTPNIFVFRVDSVLRVGIRQYRLEDAHSLTQALL